MKFRTKPRVVLLADRPNWAFDFTARSIAARLGDRYRISVQYKEHEPRLTPDRFDLLYVFFFGETYYQRFGIDPAKIIKEVASYDWALYEDYGPLSAEEFVREYLQDCSLVTTPARRLAQLLAPHRNDVYLCPKGIEPSIFTRPSGRSGPLHIGWVGNPQRRGKGLNDILRPACADRFRFTPSSGRWPRLRVARFYQTIDVLAVASEPFESQPLPLIESMAAGCFPVTTDVGIAREMVRSGVNGLIVDRSVDAFREAFQWCQEHLELVRKVGLRNAQLIAQTRSWDRLALRFDQVFQYCLARQRGGDVQPPPSTLPIDMAVRRISSSGFQEYAERPLTPDDLRSDTRQVDIAAAGSPGAVRWWFADLRASLLPIAHFALTPRGWRRMLWRLVRACWRVLPASLRQRIKGGWTSKGPLADSEP